MKRFCTQFLTWTALAVFVAGCATRETENPLPDTWMPANSIDDTARVIPLSRPYVYRVMVVDRTLLQLTKRWARDTRLKDDYKCADDFTLPARLVGKSFITLNQALAEVNDVYRLFGVTIALDGENRFSVDCVNRDVLTGIVRAPLIELQGQDKPPETVSPALKLRPALIPKKM